MVSIACEGRQVHGLTAAKPPKAAITLIRRNPGNVSELSRRLRRWGVEKGAQKSTMQPVRSAARYLRNRNIIQEWHHE
jgi:hypothetical protein